MNLKESKEHMERGRGGMNDVTYNLKKQMK